VNVDPLPISQIINKEEKEHEQAEPAPILRFARSALSPDTVWSLLTVMEKKQKKIHALMQGQTVNFPTPVAASVLNAVTFPANNESFPAGVDSLPTTVECSVLTIVTLPATVGGRPVDIGNGPAGIASLPAGIASLPAGIASLPAGIASLPAGIASLPAGIASLPAGIDCLVLTSETFPASHKPQKTRVLPGF
jgi:hypothetical protein